MRINANRLPALIQSKSEMKRCDSTAYAFEFVNQFLNV